MKVSRRQRNVNDQKYNERKYTETENNRQIDL